MWSHEKTQQIAAQAAMLTTAIRKMSLPEDITVYRGLRGDDLPGIEVGKPFIEYGFVATTLALSIAEEFSEWDDPEDMATILAIRIPRDHPGVWIQEMFDCDQRNEYEIVLPPMTTLVPEAVFPVSFTYQSLPDFQVPKRRCAICRCITTPI